MDKQIEEFVQHCQACQVSTKSTPKYKIGPNPIPRPKKPWDTISIDITGAFDNAPMHLKNIVVIIDHYSNFPEILCTTEITSQKIISWLSEVFARYGNPSNLISDNGPQFVSKEFTDFLQSCDIRHLRIAVYNPQQNGRVEVFNRYLKHGVQTFNINHTPWSEGLQRLLSNYRFTSLTPETGTSPAELFLGRKARPAFIINQSASLEEGEEPKIQNHSPNKPVIDKAYTRHRSYFSLGQKVRFKLPHTGKGNSPWSETIYTITKVLGYWTFQLSNGAVWNARKLRPVHDSKPNQPHQLDHPEQNVPAHRSPPPQPFVPRRSKRPNIGKKPVKFSPGGRQ